MAGLDTEGRIVTDTTTHKPLRVVPDKAIPYIWVPATQLPALQQLLDSHGIRYWVSSNLISWDGGPYKAIVNLRRGTDASAVQAILDGVP